MSFIMSLNGDPIGLDSTYTLSNSVAPRPISLGQDITLTEAKINGALNTYTNSNPGYILNLYINSAYGKDTNYGTYKINGSLEPIPGNVLSAQNLIITATSDSSLANQQGLPIFNNNITITQMQAVGGNELFGYPQISFNFYNPPPSPPKVTSFNFSVDSISEIVDINQTFSYNPIGSNSPIPIQINYANISGADQNGNTATYHIVDTSNTYEITGTGDVTGVQYPSSLIGKSGTISGTNNFNTFLYNLKFKNINNGSTFTDNNFNINLLNSSSAAAPAAISRTSNSLSQTIVSAHHLTS